MYQSGNIETDRYRESATKLFTYLIELQKLKIKPVLDVSKYEKIFWFDDIPSDINCRTIAWKKPNSNSGDIGSNDDIWIEIKKKSAPQRPLPPSPCKPWISFPNSNKPDIEPQLISQLKHKKIIKKTLNSDDAPLETIEYEYYYLDHYPEIKKECLKYINEQWKNWLREYKKWELIQRCYSKLFEIYQELLRLGEQYELILGLGFLTWKISETETIRRHVLVANATITFNAEKGIFTVHESEEGAKLRIETDMLQSQEKRLINSKELEIKLEKTEDYPGDIQDIFPILDTFIHTIDHRGEFERSLRKNDKAESIPKMSFAPAIILRKRTTQTAVDFYEKIVNAMKSGGKIPDGVMRLFSNPEESTNSRNVSITNVFPQNKDAVYFPLASNDEQRKIIDRLKNHQGVLVQGPPGTGKSHTIVNLICHLLANGKRVLITAQTPRALKVLQEKISEEIPPISPLCVSLLSNDNSSYEFLDKNVNNIIAKYSNHNIEASLSEIEKLKTRISEFENTRDSLVEDLKKLRGREIDEHNIVNGAYAGTAQNIAKRLEMERIRFLWFDDIIPSEQIIPFSKSAFIELMNDFFVIDSNRSMVLNKCVPPSKDFLSPEEFKSMVKNEISLPLQLKQYEYTREGKYYNFLNILESGQIKEFKSTIIEIRTEIEKHKNSQSSWESNVFEKIISNAYHNWKEYRKEIGSSIEKLKARLSIISKDSIFIPSSMNQVSLLKNVQELKNHLENGKGLGWFVFKPEISKKTERLRKEIKINDEVCSNLVHFNLLTEYLEFKIELDNLWQRFQRKTPGDIPFKEQLEELENYYLKKLDYLLRLEDKLISAKKEFERLNTAIELCWKETSELNCFIGTCRSICIEREFNELELKFEKLIQSIKNYSSMPDPNPITAEILSAMETRNVDLYSMKINELLKIEEDKKRLKSREEKFSLLKGIAPNLATAISNGKFSPESENKIDELEDAWNWARANSWLKDYLNTGNEEDITLNIRSTNNEISKLKVLLVAELAWKFFFDRMTDDQQRHLIGWKQEMKRIGKNTGKYALLHRKDAKVHFDKCKDAIPVWIMPLYRVFETIPSQPGIFDVVIVDEASQCGLDSLITLYLAKKIIIVGDDQQISPDAVGIDQADVYSLIECHLKEIEHSDSFNVTYSLFDHGERRYGNRIVLREHFRCMPEIIEFSNRICYSDTPLIPMKQPSVGRLKPIVTHYLPEGKREGKTKVFNLPEAQAIAKALVHCCNDPFYKNKTMGVISLQGNAQGYAIERLLMGRLDPKEIASRRIICGDAYSFQGDERDVVFLSMVAATNERFAALSKDSDKRRFNVAASRAKEQIWLFHSVKLEELSPYCIRYHLLNYYQNPSMKNRSLEDINIEDLRLSASQKGRHDRTPPDPFDSWFEIDVFLKITAKGYRVIPQYKAAGYRIDLVIEGKSKSLAVECDGDACHGLDSYEADLFRQQNLERIGWRFWRIRGSEFYWDQEKSLQSLWHEIDTLGIEKADEFINNNFNIEGYLPDINWG